MPRHPMTGDDRWFNVLHDSGTQINKTISWQHVSNWFWLHVYLNWLSDLKIYISYLNVDIS